MYSPHNEKKPTNYTKILQTLKELNRVDLSKADIPFLKRQISLILDEYTHTSIIILPSHDGKFHRAIKYQNRPSTIKELSYPPKKFTKLGRANFANKPKFYCSGDPAATFFELNAQPGDTVVLSKWIRKDEISIFPIGYSSETFKRLNSNRSCPSIVPSIKKHPNEFKNTNRKINIFLDEKFTEVISPGNECQYIITAVIAEEFLMMQPCSGIVYPTIAMEANAENFALTPELVDQYLQLESVRWYRVDEAKNFSYTLTLLACSNSFTDEMIEWKIPSEEERKYL